MAALAHRRLRERFGSRRTLHNQRFRRVGIGCTGYLLLQTRTPCRAQQVWILCKAYQLRPATKGSYLESDRQRVRPRARAEAARLEEARAALIFRQPACHIGHPTGHGIEKARF